MFKIKTNIVTFNCNFEKSANCGLILTEELIAAFINTDKSNMFVSLILNFVHHFRRLGFDVSVRRRRAAFVAHRGGKCRRRGVFGLVCFLLACFFGLTSATVLLSLVAGAFAAGFVYEKTISAENLAANLANRRRKSSKTRAVRKFLRVCLLRCSFSLYFIFFL